MTCLLDNVWILWGEVTCVSLPGVNGSTEYSRAVPDAHTVVFCKGSNYHDLTS